MSNIEKCPFCNSEPEFPEGKDVFGTYYEGGCRDCGIATISLQIIACFGYPRDKVHESWNDKTNQYGLEYVETARMLAIMQWNSRVITQWAIPEGYKLVEIEPSEEKVESIIESLGWIRIMHPKAFITVYKAIIEGE